MKTKAKKLTSAQVDEMVKMYLETTLSANEVGERFGVTGSNVVYHANKARKESKNAEEDTVIN